MLRLMFKPAGAADSFRAWAMRRLGARLLGEQIDRQAVGVARLGQQFLGTLRIPGRDGLGQ
jgi:hypothetical protein